MTKHKKNHPSLKVKQILKKRKRVALICAAFFIVIFSGLFFQNNFKKILSDPDLFNIVSRNTSPASAMVFLDVNLTASPNPILPNSASNITWTVSGTVDNCWGWSRPNTSPWVVDGSVSKTGGGPISTDNLTQDTTFYITCWNAYASVTKSVTVDVSVCVPDCSGAGNVCSGVVYPSPNRCGGSCTGTKDCSCVLPWGGSIANGERTIAFELDAGETTCSLGGSCVSQYRICTDGVLSGTYTKEYCLSCPRIEVFNASPETVNYNGSTVLTWTATSAWCTAWADPPIVSWSGPKSFGMSIFSQTIDNLTTDETFYLKCGNDYPIGLPIDPLLLSTITKVVSVTVAACAPDCSNKKNICLYVPYDGGCGPASCIGAKLPDCLPADTVCLSASPLPSPNGCGTCFGTKTDGACCTPNCTNNANTCRGKSYPDGCGGTCNGSRNCSWREVTV